MRLFIFAGAYAILLGLFLNLMSVGDFFSYPLPILTFFLMIYLYIERVSWHRRRIRGEAYTVITDFEKLEIKIPKEIGRDISVPFRLSGTKKQTDWIDLSQTEGSLLLFLAEECDHGAEDWLSKPEDKEVKKILKRIYHELDMPEIFGEELEMVKMLRKPQTWIWDFRNDLRKTYVKNINGKLRLAEKVRGRLIESHKLGDPVRLANYSLHRTIAHVHISNW